MPNLTVSLDANLSLDHDTCAVLAGALETALATGLGVPAKATNVLVHSAVIAPETGQAFLSLVLKASPDRGPDVLTRLGQTLFGVLRAHVAGTIEFRVFPVEPGQIFALRDDAA